MAPLDAPLSEGMFRELLEVAPDAFVIVDREGVIVIVNEQAERLFGYDRAEMVGQPVELLMPAAFRQRHAHHRAAYQGEPRMRPMGAGLELLGLRKGGEEFPVEISLSPLHTERGLFVSAVVRDVTDRRRAEQALRAASMSRPLVMRIVRALVDQLAVPSLVVSELGRSLARDVPQASVEAYVEAFNSMGLGRISLRSREGETYTFGGDDMLERRGIASQPTCHLALGFLEGAIGTLHRMRGLGTELRCQSLGHPSCVFVVKPRPESK